MTPRLLAACSVDPTALGGASMRNTLGDRYRGGTTTGLLVSVEGLTAASFELASTIPRDAMATGCGLLTFHGCRDPALGCGPVTMAWGWGDTALGPPSICPQNDDSRARHPLQKASKGPPIGGAAGRILPSKGDFGSKS